MFGLFLFPPTHFIPTIILFLLINNIIDNGAEDKIMEIYHNRLATPPTKPETKEEKIMEEKHPEVVKDPVVIKEEITPPVVEETVEETAPVVSVVESVSNMDNLIESQVILLNEILQRLNTIETKINEVSKTPIQESIPPKKRQIVVNRDENGKILGADIIETD